MEWQPLSDSSESSTSTYVDYPRQPGFNSTAARSKPNNPASQVKQPCPMLPPPYPPGDLCDILFLCRRPYRTRRVGLNSQTLGIIWFVRDTCGIICLIITWLLVLYAEFVVSGIILLRSPHSLFCWVAGFVYHLFAIMAVVSHFKAFSTDPGTIPAGVTDEDIIDYLRDMYGCNSDHVPRCTRCVSIKPPRVHHCRICSRCVRKMDHHCPWINNCVGEGNQKFFVLFTLYICLMSFFAIYMCIHFFIQCTESDWEMCQMNASSSSALSVRLFDFSPMACGGFILGLIMESMVFGLFTLVMCISQLCNIATDETKIESLSRSANQRTNKSKWQSMSDICGSPFSIKWFSPFSSSSQPAYLHGSRWNKDSVNIGRHLQTCSDETGSNVVWRAADSGSAEDGRGHLVNSRSTVIL